MKKIALTFVFFLLVLFISVFLYFQLTDCGIAPWSCGDYPSTNSFKNQKIKVGAGPEDMAIDTSLGYPRIIVSCTERRSGPTKIGTFYGINPINNVPFEFQLELGNFKIFPHGIDVVTIDSIPYLYAISHNQEGENWRHFVIRFVINGNQLILDKDHILEHELLNVPNDLDVLEDGSFYASNYVPNMSSMESTKAIIGIRNGSVVHYDGKGNWEIVLKELCYPNGIWIDQKNNQLFLANGGCQEIIRYPIEQDKVNPNKSQSTKQHGITIPIGDNLMMDNTGLLWTTAHPCPLKFLDHAKDAKHPSPAQVFTINPSTLKANKVFQNNGDLISAASTVLRLDKQLYVSQVFDEFVLVLTE